MGILYREIVDYKRRYLVKLTFAATIIIAFLDVFMFFSTPNKFYNELEYAGYILMPIAIIISYRIWQRCRTRYKYCIIDNELIIEKIIGKKRKVELNLNIKQVLSIDKSSEKRSDSEKVYNFTCGCKRKDVYRCLFKKEGKLYSFYFQPSSDFLSKIEAIKNKDNIAS